jgi:hypothetical protein
VWNRGVVLATSACSLGSLLGNPFRKNPACSRIHFRERRGGLAPFQSYFPMGSQASKKKDVSKKKDEVDVKAKSGNAKPDANVETEKNAGKAHAGNEQENKNETEPATRESKSKSHHHYVSLLQRKRLPLSAFSFCTNPSFSSNP